jgi:hypothetical protein
VAAEPARDAFTHDVPTPIRSHMRSARTAISTVHVRAMESCSLSAFGSTKRTAHMKAPSVAIDRTVSSVIGRVAHLIVSEPRAVPTRFPSLYCTTYEYVPLFQTHAGLAMDGITLIK